MKQYAFLFLMITGLIFSAFPADDTVSFVIAPPPAGYPVFDTGLSSFHGSGVLVYADYDFEGSSMKIFGPAGFATYQYCFTDRVAFSGNIGASMLAGNKHSLLIVQIPMQANAVYEVYETAGMSMFLIAGLGGDFGTTRMKITVPLDVPLTNIFYDETTLSIFNTTGRVSGGAQANLWLGKFILSPFGIYSYTAGSYYAVQNSSMSENYPSYSGTIPGFSTTVFGFDLLYVPSDISLSSQIHNTDKYTLISLAVKWLLPGKNK